MSSGGIKLKFLGPFFQKIALFHKKVPRLAIVERSPKFLEYALEADSKGQ